MKFAANYLVAIGVCKRAVKKFKLCRMDNVNTIALGSITKAGNYFVTDVKLLDVNSKKLINSVSAKGEGVESILNSQIDQICA